MSNEIQLTINMRCQNPSAGGGYTRSFDFTNSTITQTTLAENSSIWFVGTSEEDYAAGDVASPGYLVLKNLDANNFIKYGPKASGSMVEFGRLKAGECVVFRLGPSGVTLRAIADTSAVKVQTWLLSD